MNKQKGKIAIELLAPAKDKICAKTAILAGADAIYIGAEAFGARQKAGNSIEDLKEIIDFAHLFNVKVYVTVNTIFYDNELNQVKDLVYRLYDIKTDAIIFQDFSFLNTDLPPIELHASTQCHNISLEKIKFLEKCNVKRVVLPREFSISQIEEIKENTNIEIECFCHGALCVSYSGQCYLSDFIGKRSANRGECAQPCRKKYSLIDKTGKIYAKDTHLLCLKDFNAINSIDKMIKAGATSFKIEGRLKDEIYVKNCVIAYRKKIDGFLRQNPDYVRQSDGILEGIKRVDFRPALSKTFNRGFCEYFLNEKPKDITSFDTPKFKGEFIGTVKTVTGKEFTLNSKIKLSEQDGITFFAKNELFGTKIIGVNNDKYRVLDAKGISIGTKIYRNFDNKYLSELEKAELTRKKEVSFEITFGKSIEITAISGNTSVTKAVDNTFEPAQNKDFAIQNIKKQFSKLGNTNFSLKEIDLKGSPIVHFKLSELNNLRNEIIANLQEKILKNYVPRKREIAFETPLFPIKELGYDYNISNKKAKDFYEKCGSKVKEFAPEISNKYQKLMVTKHCLKREFAMCSKDVGQLYLVDEFNKKYPLNFDCKNCQMEILAPKK